MATTTPTRRRSQQVEEDGIVWEDPVPRGRKAQQVPWDQILEPLQNHPGDWARIRLYPSVNQSSAAAGSLRKSFGDNFEFASRTAEDGQGKLYARFVG